MLSGNSPERINRLDQHKAEEEYVCAVGLFFFPFHNKSIRLRLWAKACVVWAIRHTAASEESNILITARRVPADVTSHAHSYCSVWLLYIGAAHTETYWNPSEQKTEAIHVHRLVHKHNLSKHAYSPQNNYCMRGGGKHTHTHSVTPRQTRTLSRKQEEKR